MELTIDQITEELKTCDDPIRLAEFLTYLAGWASYRAEQMKKVQLVKPKVWLNIQTFENWAESEFDRTGVNIVITRTKSLSDKKTDMTWFATEDGQKEVALSYELKRIDKMMSAIKQRLYATKVEYKSLSNQI